MKMNQFDIVEYVAGVPVLRNPQGLKTLKDGQLLNKAVFDCYPAWRCFMRPSLAEEREIEGLRCGVANGEPYTIVCNVDGHRRLQTGFIRPGPGSKLDDSVCLQMQADIEVHAQFLDQLEASPMSVKVKL
jgi:hypothetical protein